MKSVAELKRDAKSGTLEARMVLHCGSEDIPERLQGWRKLWGANSVAIFFLNRDGNPSELQLPKASLIEYDGETLTVYSAGYRDLTPAEQKVMDEWKAYSSTPEFTARAEADALTDGSSTYWSEVAHFSKAGMEYLMGTKKERGMKYDWNRQQVQDENVKGEVSMRYEIRKVA